MNSIKKLFLFAVMVSFLTIPNVFAKEKAAPDLTTSAVDMPPQVALQLLKFFGQLHQTAPADSKQCSANNITAACCPLFTHLGPVKIEGETFGPYNGCDKWCITLKSAAASACELCGSSRKGDCQYCDYEKDAYSDCEKLSKDKDDGGCC